MRALEQYLSLHVGATVTPEMVVTVLSLVPRLSTADAMRNQTPAQAIAVSQGSNGKRLVVDQPERFIQFVASMTGSAAWSHAYGMGMVDDDGQIVCGVVLEDYNGACACIHVAGIGKHWLNRTFLHAVFDYAFNQLKLKRLTGLVAQGNDAAYNFDIHLGFKVESVLKNAHPNGDIYLLVMRPEDCRFLVPR